MLSKFVYCCQEIDSFQIEPSALPDLPKYAILSAFLAANSHCFEEEVPVAFLPAQLKIPQKLRTENRGYDDRRRRNMGQHAQPAPQLRMDRHGFGNLESKVHARLGEHCPLFQQDQSVDGKLKSKINELNSKITEGNFEQILKEFKALEFDQASNLEVIAQSLHRSVLVCSKYGDQILGLFQTLLSTSPQYAPKLKEQFLSYGERQSKRLLAIDESNDAQIEEKYIVRQSLVCNHELILKCLKMSIIFDETTCESINHQLLELDHPDSFEVYVRFLILQKKYGYWPLAQSPQSASEYIEQLEREIKLKKYPKRLEFLLMDL